MGLLYIPAREYKRDYIRMREEIVREQKVLLHWCAEWPRLRSRAAS